MATINLGAIKFNWKGAYNNGTSYAVDDVVSSGGNSYVCIQASQGNAVGDATAYWNIMSAKGTNGSNGSNGSNGTDLTTTLSTRGDIVFKGASALTRLPKGTAGYYLKQGANDPEWGEISSGKILGITQQTDSTRRVLSNGDTGTMCNFNTNYTQIKAGSKLRFDISIIGFQPNQGAVGIELIYDGTTHTGFGNYSYHAQNYPSTYHYAGIIDGASSTGSKAYHYRWNHNNSATGVPFTVLNPSSSDDPRLNNSVSRLIITELDI
jgi:hypothetical protein